MTVVVRSLLVALVGLSALACSKSEAPTSEEPTASPAETAPPSAPAAEPAKIDAAGDEAVEDHHADADDDADEASEESPAAAATADPPAPAAGAAPGAAPEPPKNLKLLPKTWSREQVDDYMKVISSDLGVKCKFCHDVADFAADGNKHKTIAREMMTMQDRINRDYFGGKKEVSCFTCHQGKAHID